MNTVSLGKPLPLDASRLSLGFERTKVAIRNWWSGAFGRRAAFKEGFNLAIDCAAMKAYDMGRPDIREEINKLWELAK